jgi:hypothetical protein
MKKLISKLEENKVRLIELIKIQIFLLSSKKRQRYLIEKNACMFLGLQNLAKKCDNNGDVCGAMDVSSESYKYLFDFALFCKAKGIDHLEKIKQYAK